MVLNISGKTDEDYYIRMDVGLHISSPLLINASDDEDFEAV